MGGEALMRLIDQQATAAVADTAAGSAQGTLRSLVQTLHSTGIRPSTAAYEEALESLVRDGRVGHARELLDALQGVEVAVSPHISTQLASAAPSTASTAVSTASTAASTAAAAAAASLRSTASGSGTMRLRARRRLRANTEPAAEQTMAQETPTSTPTRTPTRTPTPGETAVPTKAPTKAPTANATASTAETLSILDSAYLDTSPLRWPDSAASATKGAGRGSSVAAPVSARAVARAEAAAALRENSDGPAPVSYVSEHQSSEFQARMRAVEARTGRRMEWGTGEPMPPGEDSATLDDRLRDLKLHEYELHYELAGLGDRVRGVDRGQFEKQLHLETRAVDMAVARYRRLTEQVQQVGKGASLGPAQELLLEWFRPLTEALEKEQHLVRIREASQDRAQYGRVLLLLPAEKLAVIALHELLGLALSSASDIKFVKASQVIGEAVEAEINLARLRREDKATLARLGTRSVNTVNRAARYSFKESGFHYHTKLQVGAALIHFVLEHCKIDGAMLGDPDSPVDPDAPAVPAFEHRLDYVRRRKIGMLTVHDKVLELIESGHLSRAAMHPRFMPMLVPPKPWSSFASGGYLSVPHLVMRTKGSRRQVDKLRRAPLTEVLEGLNVLSSTEWRINSPVWEVVQEAWERGGGYPYLPQRADIPLPEPVPADAPEAERKAYRRQLARTTRMNADLHSLRCDVNHKMSVAKEFSDVSFYFPHNMDFRGRAYPIPPHLNHLGSDLSRGLLTFAEKRPLGERGYKWLKIHLANLCGVDKVSLEDRAAFADENMDKIMACVDDPFGEQWWLDAEYAWQCLATCHEIAAAVRSGDPLTYESSLPVHQDGSCNGLQHYAALGGDVDGARSVNLLPSELPQDVYSGVADLVSAEVERDAERGDPLAQILVGKIKRKTVKRPTMTSVYGSTLYGSRRMIESELGEIPEEKRFAASVYIARKTFDALGEMFTGAREIMAWLADAAQAIAKRGRPVEWTTPLGLPIVQPYRRESRYQIQTVVQTVLLADSSDDLPVHTTRQRSAMAPNFVHALDASHMFMTARECARHGLVFASVHDSYWTHASTIESMNMILRDQFVKLHQRPILEELRDELLARYNYDPENPDPFELAPLPKRGDLDLNCVRSSLYFFS